MRMVPLHSAVSGVGGVALVHAGDAMFEIASA
jgi:hypothetical protein